MKPVRYAIALALTYLFVCGAYIRVSGQIAASASLTVEELERVELVKGLLFVGGTSLLIFGLSFALFRRLVRAAEEAALSREAFLAGERRATAGLLASTVAHDFRNLLVVLGFGVEELRARGVDAGELLDDMAAAVRRATELAVRLSQAGKGPVAGDMRTTNVAAVVTETIDLLRLHPKAKRCQLVLESEVTDVSLVAYPALIRQLVTNLVVNALEAVRDRGRVEVQIHAGPDGSAIVEVHDDGAGVPEAERERLFEAFYTTKDEGTGLGLLSARKCAEMHQGEIQVSASPLGGACFRAHLANAAGGG